MPGSRRQWERDPARRRLPGVARRSAHRPVDHRAAGQRHRRRDRPGTGVAQHITQPARHAAHGPRRADGDRPDQGVADHGSRLADSGADEVRAALRAWIAQAVTWHDPTVLGVALAAPDLESRGLVVAQMVAARGHSRPARRRRPGPLPVGQCRRTRRTGGPGTCRSPGIHRCELRSVAAPADRRRRPGLRRQRLDAGGRLGCGHRHPPFDHAAAPGAVLRSRTTDPADRRRRHRPMADRRLGALHRPGRPVRRRGCRRISRVGSRGGTPIPPMPDCGQQPPAAPLSPR